MLVNCWYLLIACLHAHNAANKHRYRAYTIVNSSSNNLQGIIKVMSQFKLHKDVTWLTGMLGDITLLLVSGYTCRLPTGC